MSKLVAGEALGLGRDLQEGDTECSGAYPEGDRRDGAQEPEARGGREREVKKGRKFYKAEGWVSTGAGKAHGAHSRTEVPWLVARHQARKGPSCGDGRGCGGVEGGRPKVKRRCETVFWRVGKLAGVWKCMWPEGQCRVCMCACACGPCSRVSSEVKQRAPGIWALKEDPQEGLPAWVGVGTGCTACLGHGGPCL